MEANWTDATEYSRFEWVPHVVKELKSENVVYYPILTEIEDFINHHGTKQLISGWSEGYQKRTKRKRTVEWVDRALVATTTNNLNYGTYTLFLRGKCDNGMIFQLNAKFVDSEATEPIDILVGFNEKDFFYYEKQSSLFHDKKEEIPKQVESNEDGWTTVRYKHKKFRPRNDWRDLDLADSQDNKATRNVPWSIDEDHRHEVPIWEL